MDTPVFVSKNEKKASKWGVPHCEQEKIITRLIEEKFINEARYCRAFVNDKVRFNRWGRIKIRAALSEKRLPRELVNEAIDNIDEEQYMASLAEVIAAKRRELKGKDDYTAQQKIMRYAASRGFEPSLIIKAINYCGDEMDF